jgi:hypothetical protein
MTKATRTSCDVPEKPWDLIAEERNVMRKLWNRDSSRQPPVLKLGSNWGWGRGPLPDVPDAKRRVEGPEPDVRYRLETVRHEIQCPECSDEVGIPLANTPAFELVHFGTGPLATAFGTELILRDGDQRLAADFVRVVRGEPASTSATCLEDSVHGHLIGFLADQAMEDRRVVDIPPELEACGP